MTRLAPVPFLGLLACTGLPVGEHVGPVSGLAVDRDGTEWSCSQAGIFARPTPDAPLRRAAAVPFRPFALARVERSGHLLVAGGTPGQSGYLALVHPDGTVLHSLRLADDVLYAVAADPTGRWGAAGGADGRLHRCELSGSGMKVAAQPAHAGPCRAVAFAPDGSVLASAGRDGTVLLWRAGSEAPAPLPGHTAGVECLAFAADGKTLASGALDQRVRLHDLEGRLLRSWHRLGGAVQALAAGGRSFYAGLADGRVLRLDPQREEPEELERFSDPVHSLVLGPGELLVGLRGRVGRIPLAGHPRSGAWR